MRAFSEPHCIVAHALRKKYARAALFPGASNSTSLHCPVLVLKVHCDSGGIWCARWAIVDRAFNQATFRSLAPSHFAGLPTPSQNSTIHNPPPPTTTRRRRSTSCRPDPQLTNRSSGTFALLHGSSVIFYLLYYSFLALAVVSRFFSVPLFSPPILLAARCATNPSPVDDLGLDAAIAFSFAITLFDAHQSPFDQRTSERATTRSRAPLSSSLAPRGI